MTERGQNKLSPKKTEKNKLEKLLVYPAVTVDVGRNSSKLQREGSSPGSGRQKVVGSLQNYEMVPAATNHEQANTKDGGPTGKEQHRMINVASLAPSGGGRNAGASQEELRKSCNTLSPTATRQTSIAKRASAHSMMS